MSELDLDSSNDNIVFNHIFLELPLPLPFPNPLYISNKEKIFEINKVHEKGNKMLGRKTKNSFKKEGKCHSKYEDDNILRKIQISFINYLRSLTNEILENIGIKEKFLSIDYKFKKEVNKENFNKIKSKEIGKILCQSVSPKFSKISNLDKEKNKRLYEKVIQNETIKKLLSETYIKMFRDYYYKNIKVLNEYYLNIKLSENIKTFDDFLNDKVHPHDDYYKKRINEIIEKYYLPKKLFIHNNLDFCKK